MIIYKLTNKITNQKYIGQTTRPLEVRIKQHVTRSKINKTYIANAINKYGINNFEIILLTTCSNQEELDQQEIEFITSENTLYPNGYNLTFGGKGGKKSLEACKRMSEGQKGKPSGRKGKKYGPITDTSRMNKAKIGIKQSYQTIQKRGKKLKKKIIAIDITTNISIGFYSVKDAALFFNAKSSSIVCNLKRKTKSSHNQIFYYASENEGVLNG
jgi:group I intron endonuclease